MRVKGSRVRWSVISGKMLAYIQIKKEERAAKNAPLFYRIEFIISWY